MKIDTNYINDLISSAIKEKQEELNYNYSWLLFLGLNYKESIGSPNAILLINTELYNDWIKSVKGDYIRTFTNFDGCFEVRCQNDIDGVKLKFYWEEGDFSGLNEFAFNYVKTKIGL